MKALLIVFHSMTGAARQMAEAAAEGAADHEVQVRLVRAADATADDVLAAHAYVFATPENLAAMSGVMKDFFDRTYYDVLDRVAGRAYVALIAAGSDGHNAARQIERIATGWRLRAVAAPIIVCTHAQERETILAPKIVDPGELARCREVGAALAAGLAMGIY